MPTSTKVQSGAVKIYKIDQRPKVELKKTTAIIDNHPATQKLQFKGIIDNHPATQKLQFKGRSNILG
jgi:hypothetical protein